jgi:hypothetical protein
MPALSLISILFFAILISMSTTILAAKNLKGWQFIGLFEFGDSQYVDMSELKRERGYVRVRTMVDHKEPIWSVTSEKILSETGTDYIDCKKRQFLILEVAFYECSMARCTAQESATYPFDESGFNAIPTKSSKVRNVFDLVCQ